MRLFGHHVSPLALIGLLAVAVLPVVAFESNCPDPNEGWTCQLAAECDWIEWCGEWQQCSYTADNIETVKPHWINECSDGSQTVYCSECETDARLEACCWFAEPRPPCPTGQSCE